VNGQQRYLEKAARMYHRQFLAKENTGNPNVANGADYLTKHGIGSVDIVRKYRLGIVIDPIEETDERFRGMLAIPYLTRGGVKAIRYRNLNGGKPKFAQPEGQPIRLYNGAAYFDESEIIGLAEGEIDAIAATERLGIPTIGIPGSTQWAGKARVWTPIFKDYPMVIMFADGDPVDELTGLRPGRELAKTIGASLKWRLRTVEMPEGEDVSSMIAANRIDEIHIPKVEADDGDNG
jgi:hypothetical protein